MTTFPTTDANGWQIGWVFPTEESIRTNIRTQPTANSQIIGQTHENFVHICKWNYDWAYTRKTFPWIPIIVYTRFYNASGYKGWIHSEYTQFINIQTNIYKKPDNNQDADDKHNINDTERIKKLAMNITSTFEGGGYSTYQSYDSGIISYGRFQFTLASGSLEQIIKSYIKKGNDRDVAEKLQRYIHRIEAKDESLRSDGGLKDLLIEASKDDVMKNIQDDAAVMSYWNKSQKLYTEKYNLSSPLSKAFVFDTGIQHGLYHRMAEETYRDDIGEKEFIKSFAFLRKQVLYRLAEARNLPGLKPRADFWVNLIEKEDWDLVGGESRKIFVLSRAISTGIIADQVDADYTTQYTEINNLANEISERLEKIKAITSESM